MPEMRYRLRWPDLTETECYSPSLVIRDYFQTGAHYPVPEFLQRIRECTHVASERVRTKFGVPCLRALSQLQDIEVAAGRFIDQEDARIVMVSFHDSHQ
jgi:uncharacterized repeat protein (TIGR04042 family)